MADWKARAFSFLEEAHNDEDAEGDDDDDGEEEESEEEQAEAGQEGAGAAASHGGSDELGAAAAAAAPIQAAATDETSPGGAGDGEADGAAAKGSLVAAAVASAKGLALKASVRTGSAVSLTDAPVPEFQFPAWSDSCVPAEPRDFGATLKEYEKNREQILGGPLGGADETKLTQKQIDARKREAEKRAERKKAVEEKLAAQRKLHEEKQRKIRAREAEKELARIERERDKQIRALEREAARIALEEERNAKREELARERFEKYQEMEDRRRDKEAQSGIRRRWQERSTVQDERLPDAQLPAGICCSWDEHGQLSQGDLLMAWSFLNANGEEILAPRLSLKELCGGLLVGARALDLTDVHVALLRVLLLHMDTQMGTDYQTEPRRSDLLTNLTWPYMASMYLEENASRLGAEDIKMGKLLADQEYCVLSPQMKLRLLALLCDECLSIDPVKSKFNNSRAIDMEWNPKTRRTKHNIGHNADEEAEDDSIKSVQLLGTDRYRNRFFACQDQSGETWVLVQQVDQGCWKRYQEEFAIPPPAEGTDSDDELFAEFDAAAEQERAEERAKDEAAEAALEAQRAAMMASLTASIEAAASATAEPRPLPKLNRRGVWCEDCKVKSANYGLPSGIGKRKRWCSACSKKEGRNGVCAKDLQKIMADKSMGLPSASAGATAAVENSAPTEAAADAAGSPSEDPLRLRGAGPEGAVNPNAALQAPVAVAMAPVEVSPDRASEAIRQSPDAAPTVSPEGSAEKAEASAGDGSDGSAAAAAAAAAAAGKGGGGGGGRDNGKPVLSRAVGAEDWVWYPSQSECAKALNLEAGPISKCCNGAQKTAHGYEFKFALEQHQPDLSLKQQFRAPRPREGREFVQAAPDLTDPDEVVDMTDREETQEKWFLYSGCK
jgi:hypothetical protein